MAIFSFFPFSFFFLCFAAHRELLRHIQDHARHAWSHHRHLSQEPDAFGTCLGERQRHVVHLLHPAEGARREGGAINTGFCFTFFFPCVLDDAEGQLVELRVRDELHVAVDAGQVAAVGAWHGQQRRVSGGLPALARALRAVLLQRTAKRNRQKEVRGRWLDDQRAGRRAGRWGAATRAGSGGRAGAQRVGCSPDTASRPRASASAGGTTSRRSAETGM
jgi:hypothetical protein